MIYIQLKQNAVLSPHTGVALRDVAQLSFVGGKDKRVGDTPLARLEQDPVLITAADIAAALNREDITFTGEPSCLVTPRQKQDSAALRWLKTAFVTALLFVGGAMSVLAYQTDTDMPETHRVISRVFTGSEENGLWVTIPYCIGVGLGVLFFSNVLPGKKREPTLFEIEQYTKEQQVSDYDIAKAEEEK